MTRSTGKEVEFLARTLVVIPALNEAECIQKTIARWRALGVAAVRVVDNGSVDRTSELASTAGAETLFEPKRGYGAAAWRGTRAAPAAAE